jgi:hypothetical protein
MLSVMATPSATPTDSFQIPSSHAPYLTPAIKALAACRTTNERVEHDWNALTKQDYEILRDGSLNRKFQRRLKQRDDLVEASRGLELYVKSFLDKYYSKDKAILEYLDNAGIEWVRSRRLLRNSRFDSRDAAENEVNEVVGRIREVEMGEGGSGGWYFHLDLGRDGRWSDCMLLRNNDGGWLRRHF